MKHIALGCLVSGSVHLLAYAAGVNLSLLRGMAACIGVVLLLCAADLMRETNA